MRSTHNRSVANVDADKLPLLLPTDMRVLDAFGVVEKRASVVVAAEQVEYQGMAS